MLLNEARLLTMVNHPNVVKLIKVHETVQHVFMLMEMADAGSLKSLIRLRQIKRQPITDAESSATIKQILSGLLHIHKSHIIHRDINPKNILLNSFTKLEGAVLIADFGLGAVVGEYSRGMATERCGTMIYMAPEQLRGEKYGAVRLVARPQVVDIWATGMIMYMLLEGRHPLYQPGDQAADYLRKIEAPAFEFSDTFSE